MSQTDTAELLRFMLPYRGSVVETALWLRDFVWSLYPETNELIYDNYNALAFGWSPTDKAGDVFCSVAMFTDHVNFGFLRGSELPDKEKMLSGDGSLYRYIKLNCIADFPGEYMREMLEMAYENSLSRMKPQKKLIKGQTIVKSVSPVKRRRGSE